MVVYMRKVFTRTVIVHHVVNHLGLKCSNFVSYASCGVKVRHAEGIVVVDRWLPLRVPPKTAVLLRQLRQELERCLKAAAENPAQARSDPGAIEVCSLLN